MANMSIRIDDKLRDDFSSICKEKGIMGSAMIRGWMEEYVNENSDCISEKDGERLITDRIAFNITPDLYARFGDICKRKYLNKSAIIRKLLEDFCKENEQ